jgi:hypothetical protein
MSFLSHGSSNHNHLSRRISKKHNSLHTVTGTQHNEGAADPEKPRPFAPIQYDKDAPPPTTGFNSSIFKL